MPAVVAAFVALLVDVLESRIGAIIVSLLVSLGLSITTYKFGVAPFESLISSTMSTAGDMTRWAGYLGIDQAVTITLSAIAAKYATGAARAFLTKKA